MDRANVVASGADPSNQRWAGDQIVRTRLLDRFRVSKGFLLVQAPTGFGKSILADQLVADTTWNRPVRLSAAVAADPAQLDAEVDSDVDLLVVDDASPAALAALAEFAPSHGGLIVCLGRSLASTPGVRAAKPTRLGAPELRFDLQETHRLLGLQLGDLASDQVAYVLHSVTDGWPEHLERVVQAMAGRGSSMESVRALASRGAHLDPLIDRCLDALDESMTQSMTQMAHLGRFSSQVANVLVPDLVERATADGFPLLENNLSELVIPELLANRLAQLAPPDQPFLARILPLVLGTIGLHSTVRAYLSAEQFEEAADLLCALPDRHLDQSNQTEMLGMLRAIDRNIGEKPGLAFRRARVHRNLAQLTDQIDALTEALESGRRLGDDVVVHAAETELFAIEVQTSETEGPFEGRLAQLRGSTPDDAARATLIRLREAEAFMLCLDGNPPDLHRSLELFREVSAEWEMMGDQAQAASVLRRMISGPMMHLGRFSEAASLAGRLEGLGPDTPLGMASTAQTRMRFLSLSGRVREADGHWSYASGLVQAVGLPWMNGFMHWSRVHLGAVRDDLADAEEAFTEAGNDLGQLLESPTGTIFHAECAAAFAVLGAHDLAQRALSRCDNNEDITSRLEWQTADVVIEARLGDPARAEELALGLLADPLFPPDRSWRIQIERLVAARRADRVLEDAAKIQQFIDASAVRLGFEDLAARLLEAADAHPSEPVPREEESRTTITLLGGFSLHQDSTPVDVPSGNVSQLLKLLAISDEPRSIDFVIDQLWPDASEEVGRRRLKNVLTRLRKTTTSPLFERTENTVELAADVGTDLQAFREAAQRATAEFNAARRFPLCFDAINLYAGPVLPGDLYDDEISSARMHAEQAAASVFEMLLDVTEPGRLSAAWVLETAGRLGIESDQLYVRIAELAVDSGSEVCASQAMARAATIAESLEVPLLFDERLRHLLPAS